MKPRYIILMDFSTGELIKIKLSEQELKESEECDDFEEFLCTLEAKYEFRLRDCLYMTCHNLSERDYNIS